MAAREIPPELASDCVDDTDIASLSREPGRGEIKARVRVSPGPGDRRLIVADQLDRTIHNIRRDHCATRQLTLNTLVAVNAEAFRFTNGTLLPNCSRLIKLPAVGISAPNCV